MKESNYKIYMKTLQAIEKHLNREDIYRAKKELTLLKTLIKRNKYENDLNETKKNN